jgi:inner membrane transporter RhtA
VLVDGHGQILPDGGRRRRLTTVPRVSDRSIEVVELEARVLAPVPPTGLVLVGIGTTQLGAALAKSLFDQVGAAGTVLLRVLFAALILLVLWRPGLLRWSRSNLALAAGFGIALAGMNFSFYAAIDRIPLGIAVTLEFSGPLAVALLGSRRALDLLWAVLAGAGIVLLADPGGGTNDATGVALALVAGACWAAYILLSQRAGRAFPGGTGLAIAMAFGAVLLLPVGVASSGADLLAPGVLAVGASVAILSSALPYSLELEALRRLPAHVFGVLMSLEPAVAALVGFAVLGEVLGAREVAAILLVVVASAGASRAATTAAPPDV